MAPRPTTSQKQIRHSVSLALAFGGLSIYHATQANTAGASATRGRASNRPSKGKAARQTTSP
jgi:hypothetical protein